MPDHNINGFKYYLGISLIIGLITLALLEATGLGYYYLTQGEWFYSRAAAETKTTPPATPTPLSKLVLHPYLGFIRRPGTPISRVAGKSRLDRMLPDAATAPDWVKLRSNNYGFFAATDYPAKRTDPSEYLIGIFGGSVGHWFALQGAEKLKTQLETEPEFQERNIRILNYAQSGFKQPQQLQTLSYFLMLGQSLDFVVNIDGFNELTLATINRKRRIDADMPSAQQLLPILKLMNNQPGTTDNLSQIYHIVEKQRQLSQLDSCLADTASAAIHLIASQLRTLAEKQLSVLNFDHQKNDAKIRSKLYPLRLASPQNDNENLFALWSGSAKVMQGLAEANGIHYLELVQPNQYASAKFMSAAEKKIAWRANSPYRPTVEKYYPQLPEWIDARQTEGINIHAATDIFDAVQAATYSDDCCHYNQLGNEVLAETTARLLLQTLREKPSESP